MRYFLSTLLTLVFFSIPLIGETQPIKDKDLILYVPFDDVKGDKVKDFSQTGAVGILQKKPKVVDGPEKSFGKALEFDGTSNFVQFDVDLSPQATDKALSICAWVKVLATGTDGHGQNRQPIVMKGAGGQWEYALYIYDGFGAGFSLWQCGGSGHSEPSSNGNTPKGEWHAVCGTYKKDGKTLVYVDGKIVTEDATRRGAACDGTRPVMIAHREDGQFLNAQIDDVRMYKRELTAKEVKTLMKLPLLTVEPAGKLATSWGRIKISF